MIFIFMYKELTQRHVFSFEANLFRLTPPTKACSGHWKNWWFWCLLVCFSVLDCGWNQNTVCIKIKNYKHYYTPLDYFDLFFII